MTPRSEIPMQRRHMTELDAFLADRMPKQREDAHGVMLTNLQMFLADADARRECERKVA